MTTSIRSLGAHGSAASARRAENTHSPAIEGHRRIITRARKAWVPATRQNSQVADDIDRSSAPHQAAGPAKNTPAVPQNSKTNWLLSKIDSHGGWKCFGFLSLRKNWVCFAKIT